MDQDIASQGGIAAAAPPERLARLRAEIARRGLDGFLVPRADEHQGEYVPPSADRLRWLTGFAGSAGMAVVLADQAAIFVDGRYTLQVRDQVNTGLFTPRHLIEEPPQEWLAKTLTKGQALAYDPWLHTLDQVERLGAALAKAGAKLVPVTPNPLDTVWTDRPAPPQAPLEVQGMEFAGETAADKRKRIGASLAQTGADLAVLTNPDSIAWLLNVRGGDVPHTPFPLSFALIDQAGAVDLFIDPAKLTDEVRSHFGNEVALKRPHDFAGALEGLSGRKVRIDPMTAAQWIADHLQAGGAILDKGPDPVQLPKARKNATELNGARAAHSRDGMAVTRFLKWLSEEAPKGQLTEIAASDRLEAFRKETGLLRDLSFDTISGAGPNGAIVHYRADARTNRAIKPGELYLVDSGGQYKDGTTDITRTIAVGPPGAEEKDRFTRVLKGHIALATIKFPKGTTGSQLDILARMFLWQAGLDYDHGTGHGVGSYLSVHEGPQRIAKVPNTVALEPGMILSNEPGYYKTGGYGIRIENLIAVTEPEEIPGGERPMMGFETLTLAPIDLNLVEPALLTAEERQWLNAYHVRVRDALMPQADAAEQAYLISATRAI